MYNTFDQHATTYEQAAKVQQEIGERLFERLDYLKIKPKHVLDLGCGTGLFSLKLKKYYPRTHIVSFDLAFSMLREVEKKQHWWRRWSLVQGDMAKLPFKSHSFDLILSNQVIHWAEKPSSVFQELNRIMAPQACLIFSTLGPDTFKELKIAWEGADSYVHAHEFKDMHEVGDLLLKNHLLDPVMDRELLTVHYSSLKDLLRSLKAQGVQNGHKNRNKGLTSKEAWGRFESRYQALRTNQGKYPLGYEIVYGHAWKGQPLAQGKEAFFPISQLQRKEK